MMRKGWILEDKKDVNLLDEKMRNAEVVVCRKKIIRDKERYCRYLLANGGCTKRDEIMCVEFTEEEIRRMKCVYCSSLNIHWNGCSTVCYDCEGEITGTPLGGLRHSQFP
jgi:hypothetical protein